MNILFVSFDADPPYYGGVATMTHILASEFIKLGHNCFLGYTQKTECPSNFFKEKIFLHKSAIDEIRQFSHTHHIDVILSQFITVDYSMLSLLKSTDTRVFTVFHTRPMLHGLQFETLSELYKKSDNIYSKIYTMLKMLLLPFLKYRGKNLEKKQFNSAYLNSDKLILLSQYYLHLLKRIIPNLDAEKIAFIGNPVVFDEKYKILDLPQKQKKVLVVASTNHVKRIPTILRIWKEIEKDSTFNEWSFTFVGEGVGFDKIKQKVLDLNLKRVTFTGFTSPMPYYMESSIMLMTSKYEGWPMVLMEGQQMGVVPICYNSFESLPEIIDDGKNGIVVPNNNFNLFVTKLKELMLNTSLRLTLAENAILSSEQHSKEKSVASYLNLFSKDKEN